MASTKSGRWNPGRTMIISALLTVSEAAKYLGVNRQKIYQLIEWGEIKGVKLGRSVQVEKESLEQFRASGKLT
jgi:excisionase family DNA binding protein